MGSLLRKPSFLMVACARSQASSVMATVRAWWPMWHQPRQKRRRWRKQRPEERNMCRVGLSILLALLQEQGFGWDVFALCSHFVGFSWRPLSSSPGLCGFVGATDRRGRKAVDSLSLRSSFRDGSVEAKGEGKWAQGVAFFVLLFCSERNVSSYMIVSLSMYLQVFPSQFELSLWTCAQQRHHVWRSSPSRSSRSGSRQARTAAQAHLAGK